MQLFLLTAAMCLFCGMIRAQSPAGSPLPACPDTPNCVHEAFTYAIPASDLALLVDDALQSLSPESIERGSVDSLTFKAVFKIFTFQDDVDIAIVPGSDTTSLYVRSASRVGHSDLGVNRRRINRLMKKLEERRAQR